MDIAMLQGLAASAAKGRPARRLRAATVALGVGAFLLSGAPSAAADPPSRAAARTATLTAASTGMAYVPHNFTIATKPALAQARAQVQVATSAGWVGLKKVRLDARGRATVQVTYSSTGIKKYRAAVLNASGSKVAAYSPAVSVRWKRLSYSVSLTCSKSSVPIRVDVPCTIRVTPAVRLSGMVEVIQVMGRVDWQSFDSWSVPKSGVRQTSVEGYDPGLGRYRVRLVRNGVELAVSNVFSISYSPPAN